MSRILVVEDEESYPTLSRTCCFAARATGAVAETGPSTLAQFDKNGADLVLLDLMLPNLST